MSSSKLGVLAMDRFCFRNDKQLESWKLWPLYGEELIL
jgi:hypothetical protein